MFEHLRYRGAFVEPKSKAGEFAADWLDLNDPAAVGYRELTLRVVEKLEMERSDLKRELAEVQKSEVEGRLLPELARKDFDELSLQLTIVDLDLARYLGTVPLPELRQV